MTDGKQVRVADKVAPAESNERIKVAEAKGLSHPIPLVDELDRRKKRRARAKGKPPAILSHSKTKISANGGPDRKVARSAAFALKRTGKA